MRPPCSVEGCSFPNVGRGLCRKHYLRWYKHGDPSTVKVARSGQRPRRHQPKPLANPPTPLETPCREWYGRRHPKGYGVIWRDGKFLRVHRWIWIHLVGPIPDGVHVLHRCDNPPCFRLDHLRLGTPKANTQDMLAKGRSANGFGRTKRR